jgi:hypothetical protein
MTQVARDMTDDLSGCLGLVGKSHLIIDRDTEYTEQLRRTISEARTAVIRRRPDRLI